MLIRGGQLFASVFFNNFAAVARRPNASNRLGGRSGRPVLENSDGASGPTKATIDTTAPSETSRTWTELVAQRGLTATVDGGLSTAPGLWFRLFFSARVDFGQR